MPSTAPTTPVPDAPAASAPAPASVSQPSASVAPDTPAPATRKSFLARPAVRWGAAGIIALLLAGGGFIGGFAVGAASALFGPSSTTMNGPGGSGFPGGQFPGDGRGPGDGQMPQRLGTGSGGSTDSGTGTGTDGGASSGTTG